MWSWLRERWERHARLAALERSGTVDLETALRVMGTAAMQQKRINGKTSSELTNGIDSQRVVKLVGDAVQILEEAVDSTGQGKR